MPNFSVITDKCIKDFNCVAVCLKKAIHPKKDEAGVDAVKQLFVNPKRCQNCGSCIAACESGAIFEVDELPEELHHFIEVNAAYFRK